MGKDKKNHVVLKSSMGNESNEELTGEAKGIMIQQVVEIQSQERDTGGKVIKLLIA